MKPEIISTIATALKRAAEKEKMPCNPRSCSISNQKVVANLCNPSDDQNQDEHTSTNKDELLMITNEQSICSQIDLITSLSTKELRQLWRKKIGTESSPHMQKRALIERLAYNTQETILGGLSEATQERLKMFNTRLKQGKPLLDDKIELVPGTILTREYKDRKHVIKILEHENVEYKGEVYTSLSAVARKITGTQWNGRKFFHVEDK